VQTRLGSKSTLRAWRTTAGGTDAGQVLVGLEYPDQASWAVDSTKVQADAEWLKIQAGLADVRTVVSNAIWRDVSPVASKGAGGGTMLLTGITVKPGKRDEYLKRVSAANAINERLGMKNRIRVWEAEIAGQATGSLAVGVEYADLASYVGDQEKLAADAEWQKVLASLDEVRTVTGRWLYQEIAP